MVDWKSALKDLTVGDIFHAESPNGASLICLVMSVSDATIETRTVTSQLHLTFDKQTGIAETGDEPVLCTIDSIAPLPVEIYNEMLGIDRKFRLEKNVERLKLTSAEKKALIFINSFYASNPL